MNPNDDPNPNRVDFAVYATAGANKVVLVASGLALVLGSFLATVFVR